MTCGSRRARTSPVAERFRKRWSDDETRLVIEADPKSDDYYGLATTMGRTPVRAKCAA